MSTNGESPAGDSSSAGRYEGYSHYKTVSNSITQSIDEAIEAYALIESFRREGIKVRRDKGIDTEIARSRAKIKLAALKLVPELKEEAETNDHYKDILARWRGSYKSERADGESETITPNFNSSQLESGYFEAFDNVQLTHECPTWLEDWIIDIRTAGWELGYLKAGRRAEEPSEGFEPADVKEMFG